MKRAAGLKRTAPLKRARKTARRVSNPCQVRGCRSPIRAEGMCAKHLKRECDRIFSLIVRAAGECAACGSKFSLQAAHIVSRRYAATRYTAAVCLCARCHTRFTHDPLGWDAWCEQHLGYEYELIKAKALAGGKLDWPVLLASLRREAERLGVA